MNLFTDRLFAFRIGATFGISACLRSGMWHRGEVLRTLPRISVPGASCHPRSARGIVQPEPFDGAWFTPSYSISEAFMDTLPDRAGLLEVDAARVGGPGAPATGYRCHEAGRLVIACPDCGAWHVVQLDGTPEPGYRLTVLPGGCAPLRVGVDARRWRSSWAQRGKQGRRVTVHTSPAYVDASAR